MMYLGSYLARLHDEAMRDRLCLPLLKNTRNCQFCKRVQPIKGGTRIGSMWCCAKCKEVVG